MSGIHEALKVLINLIQPGCIEDLDTVLTFFSESLDVCDPLLASTQHAFTKSRLARDVSGL